MSGFDIRVDNLSCNLGGKEILSSFTFDLPVGKYTSLIGPNGAGKTTLLKCMMKFLPISGGSVEIRGRRIEEYSQKKLAREIGYVPQDAGRSIPFSVEEFALMGRYPYLSPFSSITEDDRRIVKSALEMTGTEEFADRGYDTLSGGEKQLVLIASVLAQGPKIMLLDEPSTFLDPKHTEMVHRILDRIKRELNVTILVVTHDINSSIMMSDGIVAIKKGRMVFSGEPQEITLPGILDKVFDKKFTYTEHPVTGRMIIVPDVMQ
ncbi:MAG: ABC transporter ATP-binding protein [Candidatus Krumholzibacteriota bacterium]|nr:ABC transporter ATP-binding protein [Candidatus Krumholzibacteriota bacterium]